jgi:hypothetical protein
MKEIKTTKIKVARQGAPIISNKNASIVSMHEDIIALTIDMKSKYCKVGSTGSVSTNWDKLENQLNFIPTINISSTEDSLYLKKGKDLDEDTEISFPEFPNYNVFSTDCGRYSINVTLIKH